MNLNTTPTDDNYKDDNHMIEELSNHILDNRQTKTYESIKHKN